MSKKDAYFLEAQDLYVRGKTLVQIAELLPVSRQSLTKWKREGDWENKRRAYLTTGAGSSEVLRDAIMKLIEEIRENGVDGSRADELAKLVGALSKLERTGDLRAAVLLAMRRFSAFVADRYPEEKKKFYRVIRDFFRTVEREM